MSKTICVYHSRDLDGWMSAAIVKLAHNPIKTKKIHNSIVFPHTIEFLGWDYGDEIPDLSEYDKVIMCDVCFPLENMKNIAIDQLKSNNTDKFIWIDHHKSAIDTMYGFMWNYSYIKGKQDVNYAACELTWKYFFPNDEMPEIVRLLGRYDCFGHKGTDEEKKVLEFQYGARQVISNYGEAYEELATAISTGDYSTQVIQERGKTIYQYLCTEAKQSYKKAFPIILQEENWFDSRTIIGEMTDGSWKNRKFLCVNQERFNPINFGIDYHADGYDGFACFWLKDGYWNWSLYNDNGQVDCSAIAKQYGGGGHKGAAGFVIDNLNDTIK